MQTARTVSANAARRPVVREAVGIFNDIQELHDAMDDFEQNGFMRQELSVLAPESVASEKNPAAAYERVEHAADDPEAKRAVFVPHEIIGEIEGTVIAVPMYVAAIAGAVMAAGTGGSMPAAFATAGVCGAAGALIGYLLARHIAARHATRMQALLDRGGLLLWATVRNPQQERKARRILSRHSARSIHIHEIRA